MNLAEFKSNFFLEYSHRTIGHLIGLVFLIPLSFAILHQAGSMILFRLSLYWIRSKHFEEDG